MQSMRAADRGFVALKAEARNSCTDQDQLRLSAQHCQLEGRPGAFFVLRQRHRFAREQLRPVHCRPRLERAQGRSTANPEQLNITEWLYNGVWFDGFWSSECTVVDAKGRYAQFLDEDGEPKRGFQSRVVFPEMVREALSQAAVVAPALPQARVEWHFMERATYLAVRDMIQPPISTHFTPLLPIQA